MVGDPDRIPGWDPIPRDDQSYWRRFERAFAFQPGTDPATWPAIREPAPSVTYDLSPEFQSGRLTDRLETAAIKAMVEAFPEDTVLIALDWFHFGYRFCPHRFHTSPDATSRRAWPVPVTPNGDYSIFFTEDLSSGLFGHPWEQTLCVIGRPLLDALSLDWLPITRDHRPNR